MFFDARSGSLVTNISLKLALDRYDRHFPFFDGTVKAPDGVGLNVLQVGQTVQLRDGEDRHERMIHDKEFDICEFSMASFLMAKSRDIPITAIPIFPRRLFSQGLIFVSEESDIDSPQALSGKRVALNSYQTTLSVLARGDLKFEYGVPWEDIHWRVTAQEKIPFQTPPKAKIEFIDGPPDLGDLLESNQIDAFIHPHPPKSVTSGRVKVRSVFPSPKEEELRYFKKNGYMPIMHVLAIRQELAERESWLASAVMDMYRQATEISASYYEDPNWSQLAWGRRYFEEERGLLGGNAWPIGLGANRKNLERFIQYAADQGLLDRELSVDELFDATTLSS
jgi:4,5-dihydroxyphthalate decarboxylase